MHPHSSAESGLACPLRPPPSLSRLQRCISSLPRSIPHYVLVHERSLRSLPPFSPPTLSPVRPRKDEADRVSVERLVLVRSFSSSSSSTGTHFIPAPSTHVLSIGQTSLTRKQCCHLSLRHRHPLRPRLPIQRTSARPAPIRTCSYAAPGHLTPERRKAPTRWLTEDLSYVNRAITTVTPAQKASPKTVPPSPRLSIPLSSYTVYVSALPHPHLLQQL